MGLASAATRDASFKRVSGGASPIAILCSQLHPRLRELARTIASTDMRLLGELVDAAVREVLSRRHIDIGSCSCQFTVASLAGAGLFLFGAGELAAGLVQFNFVGILCGAIADAFRAATV